MIELLDRTREYFVRYGGHRQAAGFTIETEKLSTWKEAIYRAFSEMHDVANLPKRKVEVECILDPILDITLENIAIIDQFRPFGIGNRKPLFLLSDVTLRSVKPLGKDGKHLQITLDENPHARLIIWSPTESERSSLIAGNIASLIVELDENEWNHQKSVSVIIKDIILDE